MPTCENWIDPHIIAVKWTSPLTPDELGACFRNLKSLLEAADYPVHILFDLRETGSVPPQAPVLAVRSKFLEMPSLDKVVVVSNDIIAQILAKTASSVTRREILFFPLYDVAVNYLQSDPPSG